MEPEANPHHRVRPSQMPQPKLVQKDQEEALSQSYRHLTRLRTTAFDRNIDTVLTVIHSPYTQAPVKVYIGADKIVHYLPRHLVPHSWVHNVGLYFPSLEAETGHTLVHFLYTGLYATLDTGAESSAVQLRRALRVYIAASTYTLSELRRLAMQEIERHTENMNLPDTMEAIRDDFEKVPIESQFHAYLLTKMTAAFHNDRTVFKSERLFKIPGDTALTRFAMQKAMALFQDEMSKLQLENINLRRRLEEDIQELEVQQVVREHDTGRISPLEDVFTMDECQQSNAGSFSSDEWASPTGQDTDWSGVTIIEDAGAELS
jgi:hypothetical protein